MDLKVVIIGCGKLGKAVQHMLLQNFNIEITHMIHSRNLHILQRIEEIDILIDASSPTAIDAICECVYRTNCCLICATTGYNLEQMIKLQNLSYHTCVVYSANFSIGVTILQMMLKDYASLFTQYFDFEIIEKHHHKKIDQPSGTALEFAKCLSSYQENINISSIRKGTIIGEHEICGFGMDEHIKITHVGENRCIYAYGICCALEWIIGQPNGWYTMEDVLQGGDHGFV